jgi:hypothetical protein
MASWREDVPNRAGAETYVEDERGIVGKGGT